MTDNHTTEPSIASDTDTYEVGKNKPPKAHQFQAGQSGNPKGRPKGSKNLRTLMNEQLDTLVAIKENGQVLTVTKREALVRTLQAKALKGDMRAIGTLLELDMNFNIQQDAPKATHISDAYDLEIVHSMQAKLAVRHDETVSAHTDLSDALEEERV